MGLFDAPSEHFIVIDGGPVRSRVIFRIFEKLILKFQKFYISTDNLEYFEEFNFWNFREDDENSMSCIFGNIRY